jgi:hypothetical protein
MFGRVFFDTTFGYRSKEKMGKFHRLEKADENLLLDAL